MARQFKKVSLSLITSCLLFDFASSKTPCQNGYDYNNECDPYTNVNFIPVKLPSKQEVAIENEAIELKDNTASKITISKESKSIIKVGHLKDKSYLNALRDRYSQQYNGNTGLQALNDRSNYFNKIKEKLKEEKVSEEIPKSTSPSVKIATKEKNSVSDEKIKILKNSLALNKTIIYTVEKGDSLSKIAKKFALNKKDIISLNNMDKNKTIKIGQKLKIPSGLSANKLAKQKRSNKNIYIVQKGDTLIKIAKKLNISIIKLREINRISRSSSIKVGQKISLVSSPPKRNSVSYDIVKNTKLRKVPSLKYKRKIRVVATAYTSHRNQTDKTPFLAAWNNRLKPGMKIIAVSEDLIKKYGLTNGVKVKILGLPGYYVVRDKMNKRLRNHIDIYMGTNKRKALQWGRRRIVLYW